MVLENTIRFCLLKITLKSDGIGGMRWVWRGRIDKCVPNSEKFGVQYGPTAAGRRAVLHPQFQRMRFALSMCPSQTHCIYIVINTLKPAMYIFTKIISLWTEMLTNILILQFTFRYTLFFSVAKPIFISLFLVSKIVYVWIDGLNIKRY